MKTVVCQNNTLSLTDTPEPRPGKGQVLLNVLRCGICGSDLHARDHCDHWGDMMAKAGYRHFMRSSEPAILGHEFCGEVAEHGPGCTGKIKPGTRVVAMPA